MMVLINSCMITHYIVEENIFAVTVYKILEEQKHWNIENYFNINGKQMIEIPKKGEYVRFKNHEKNHHLWLTQIWGNYISTRRSWEAKSNKY